MQKYEFQIVLSDVTVMTEEIADALYEAGCDDGTPFSSQGIAAIGFTRAGASLEQAIRSAIGDVQKAGYAVASVESPDDAVFSQINEELAQS